VKAKFDISQFEKSLTNALKYSEGFLEGVQQGKSEMLKVMGDNVIDRLKSFIDLQARVDPESLHHVYEWYQTGMETGRLFEIDYRVSGGGLSINSTFRQSQSMANGSNSPFYDKAKIMEEGIPVRIIPKQSGVLVFDDNGETVFTKQPVDISRPGGSQVQGSFEKVFDSFFDVYFSQSFLSSSGLSRYIGNPKTFKDNISAGSKSGKSFGRQIGYNWIVKAGDSV